MPHGRGVGVLTMVMPTMYTRLSVLTCLLHRTVLQVTFEWAGANRSLSTCGLTWDPWRMEEALARCVSRQYLGSALVAVRACTRHLRFSLGLKDRRFSLVTRRGARLLQTPSTLN